MRIGSILENQKIEKRISITPEIVKKYISLGFEIFLSENYGLHLGIKDDEYLKLGAKVEKDDSSIVDISLGARPITKVEATIYSPNKPIRKFTVVANNIPTKTFINTILLILLYH